MDNLIIFPRPYRPARTFNEKYVRLCLEAMSAETISDTLYEYMVEDVGYMERDEIEKVIDRVWGKDMLDKLIEEEKREHILST